MAHQRLKPLFCLIVTITTFVGCRDIANSNEAQSTPTPTEVAQSKTPAGDSPWLKAAEANDLKTINELIAKGVDVNERDKGGRTALVIAVKNQYTDMVKVLLTTKIDIDTADNLGNTPLLQAISRNYQEITKMLLEQKANVNIKDSNGFSPLMKAAGAGNLEVTKLLIAKGAFVNAKANNGWSALKFAENHPDIVAVLKQAGAKE